MAITIRQESAQLHPAYNDVIYVITSNNVANDNFKFVCDIYVGGVKVDRMLVPPHPTFNTGVFNIGRVLENRVTKDINITDNRILENTNSHVIYTLKFGEAYGTTGTIVYPDLATVNTRYLWNACLDFPDFVSYSSGDYIASSGSPCSFLTNKPSSGDIHTDDNAWLYWNDLNLKSTSVEIKTYNSSLATIGTWRVDNKFTTSRFLRCVTGVNNIGDIPDSQFTTGLQPVFSGSEHSYSVQILDSANNPITEKYHYTITDNCSRYKKRRLQFLNKLGGYDFFDFTLVSRENVDIEKTTYKKNLGAYSTNRFTYSLADRAITQYHTKVKDKISIQSDWVRESVYEWLEELVTSPDVLLDDGTSLIPINITNATFEKKKEVNEKLFNLQIEYTLSYERYRQRF